MADIAPVATILVEDQDNLIISGLEVRNFRERSKDSVPDEDAYGILIRNNGKRSLSGFELHDLVVQDVYPISGEECSIETRSVAYALRRFRLKQLIQQSTPLIFSSMATSFVIQAGLVSR